jgi:hypothetical protein
MVVDTNTGLTEDMVNMIYALWREPAIEHTLQRANEIQVSISIH